MKKARLIKLCKERIHIILSNISKVYAFIPFELIQSNRDTVRKATEAYLITVFKSSRTLYTLLVPTELTISNICTSLMLILTSVGLFARELFAGIGLKPLW